MTRKIRLLGVGMVVLLLAVCFTDAVKGTSSVSLSGGNELLSSPSYTPQESTLNHYPSLESQTRGYNQITRGKLSPNKLLSHPNPLKGQRVIKNLFSGSFRIHTTYEGISKNTPIIESIIEGIDVDNDPSTGVNGKDIKISFFIFPYPNQVGGLWVLWVSSFFKVIRLGEEIKYGDFEIYLEATFSLNTQHTLRIGYSSPKNEEIPKEIDEVVTIVPYLFYEEEPEFYIDMAPTFEGGHHDLSVFVEYLNQGSHSVTIDYAPAVDTTIRLTPQIETNEIDFTLQRDSSVEQTIKIQYTGLMTLSLTLEDIPQTMSFSLGVPETFFEYRASDEFNATLTIEVKELDIIMKIEYLPRHFKIQFLPEGGYLYILINSHKTHFVLANDETNPTKSFTITNLTGESTIRWQSLGKRGYTTIQGLKGLEFGIMLKEATYNLHINSVMETEFFDIRWVLETPGFVSIDTNFDWLNSCSFTLTIGPSFGILIQANFIRADDFQVSWQTAIPFFTRTGTFNVMGDLTFQIMLNGTWYPVF